MIKPTKPTKHRRVSAGRQAIDKELTDEEKITLFCEAENLRDKADAIAAEREATNKDLAAEIKVLEKAAREKGMVARRGISQTVVDIEVIEDLKTKTVQRRRLDTGEVIHTREMIPSELQIELDDDEYDDQLAQPDDKDNENEAA